MKISDRTWLRMRLVGVNEGDGATCRARVLKESGEFAEFEVRYVLQAADSFEGVFQQLPKGELLGASVEAHTGLARLGELYCLLELVYQQSETDIPFVTLATGYVSANQGISWPGTPAMESSRVFAPATPRRVTDPAAGANWSRTLSGFGFRRLLSIHAQFTTDATAANRDPLLIIDDGTLVAYQQSRGVNLTASTTWNITWAPDGDGAGADGSDVMIYMPHMSISEGMRIRVDTANLQAGDAWENIVLFGEQYYD